LDYYHSKKQEKKQMDAKTFTKEELIELHDEVVEFSLNKGLKTESGTYKNGLIREMTGKDQIAASNDNRVRSGNKAVEGFIYISRLVYMEVAENTYKQITFDEASSLKNSDLKIILEVMAELAGEADFLSRQQ
jgi:hypothetical protein